MILYNKDSDTSQIPMYHKSNYIDDNRHGKIINLSVYQEIALFLTIGLISYIIDMIKEGQKYNNCNKPLYTNFVTLIHHLFTGFLYFGWLSNHKNVLLFYLLTIFTILLLFLLNKWRCVTTVIVNENCNINIDKNFSDLLYYTNIKKYKLYYHYIFFAIMFALLKLQKM